MEIHLKCLSDNQKTLNRLIGTDYDDDGVPGTVISKQKLAASVEYLGTLRGRLGFNPSQSFLIFGTEGLAYRGVELKGENFQYWSFSNSLTAVTIAIINILWASE